MLDLPIGFLIKVSLYYIALFSKSFRGQSTITYEHLFQLFDKEAAQLCMWFEGEGVHKTDEMVRSSYRQLIVLVLLHSSMCLHSSNHTGSKL